MLTGVADPLGFGRHNLRQEIVRVEDELAWRLVTLLTAVATAEPLLSELRLGGLASLAPLRA